MNSKEFENHLQLKNFEELDRQYKNAKNFFLNLQEQITCKEVSERFPAYCLFNQEIRIKFPTYFIRIINNQITYRDLEDLLEGLGNYFIYEEPNVIKRSTYESVPSLAIHCLETSLEDNTKLVEKIEEILKDKKIDFERCVSSGQYRIPIQVDEHGYISLLLNEESQS